MKVFLIGFMGSGKSTLGKKLATALGHEFIDLDKIIVQQAGMSIAEYFEKYGEDAFRKLEQQVLTTYAYAGNSVIATGGGVPCFFDNMAWMNANGTTVYIELSPKALVQRLINAKDERPLIKSLSHDELLGYIEHKLAERDIYYKKAKLQLSGIGLNASKIAEELKALN